ncbi:MAG: hypothetical protein AAGD92_03640 [Pseudomonadota bacterium]
MKLQAFFAAGFAALGLAVIAPTAASAATAPQAVTLAYQSAGVTDADLYSDVRFRGRGFHKARGFHGKGFHGKGFHKKSYYGGHGYYGKSFKHKGVKHKGFHKGVKHKSFGHKGFKGSHKVIVKKGY